MESPLHNSSAHSAYGALILALSVLDSVPLFTIIVDQPQLWTGWLVVVCKPRTGWLVVVCKPRTGWLVVVYKPRTGWLVVVCKPTVGSDLVLKSRTVHKFDIHSDGFLAETACNPKFKLKVTKITLLAFSVQIKNAL